MTKNNCIASISTTLTRTASWRLALDGRYPDHRNARAAKNLAKLADESSGMSDSQWAALEPFVASPRWNHALRKATRQVGFFYRKASFAFFVRSLIRLLDEPATVA
jgi:hypothetical protein